MCRYKNCRILKCADLKNIMHMKKLQVQDIKLCRFKNIMSLKKLKCADLKMSGY